METATINIDYKAIGMKIKKYRKAAGFTQEELATVFNSDARNIRSWESGAKIPRFDNFIALCVILGVTPNDILVYTVNK